MEMISKYRTIFDIIRNQEKRHVLVRYMDLIVF